MPLVTYLSSVEIACYAQTEDAEIDLALATIATLDGTCPLVQVHVAQEAGNSLYTLYYPLHGREYQICTFAPAEDAVDRIVVHVPRQTLLAYLDGYVAGRRRSTRVEPPEGHDAEH
jgi:hypothetical protein